MGAQNNLRDETANAAVDVPFDEALDKVGTGWFQYKVILVGGIAVISSFIPSSAIGYILPAAQCDLEMNSEEKGKLASAPYIALVFSCHMWGFLSDTLGRRYVLIRCLFCDALIYLVTMLIPNYYGILMLRVLSGVSACGGFVSLYAYVGEFQTDKFRSTALIITSFIAFISTILLPAMAWVTISATWKFELYPGLIFKPWRLFYILSGIPSLLAALCLCFLPESPKFLLAKGKSSEALKVLKRMHKENNNDKLLTIQNIKVDEKEQIAKLEENKSKIAAFFQLVWNQTVPLLRKPHRNNFILISLALFCIYYINTNLYVWLPEAINKMEVYRTETGKNDGTYCLLMQHKIHHNQTNLVTKSNSSEFLHETVQPTCNDEVDKSVYIHYLILGSLQITVWLIVVFITRFLNKKYLLMAVSVGALTATSSMMVSSTLIFVPIKASLVILCTGVLFPVINVVIVDLFPTNIRAMASCLTLIASRIGSTVTNTVAGILIDSHCSTLLWSIISAAGATFILISLLPSTEAKSKPPKGENENI